MSASSGAAPVALIAVTVPSRPEPISANKSPPIETACGNTTQRTAEAAMAESMTLAPLVSNSRAASAAKPVPAATTA